MTLISQRITAPTKAGINPSMVKPGTKRATRSKSSALMTKVKRPSVKIFIGSVSIKIIGFISVFIIPRATATISAVVKELTWNPDTYCEARTIASAEIIQLARIEN